MLGWFEIGLVGLPEIPFFVVHGLLFVAGELAIFGEMAVLGLLLKAIPDTVLDVVAILGLDVLLVVPLVLVVVVLVSVLVVEVLLVEVLALVVVALVLALVLVLEALLVVVLALVLEVLLVAVPTLLDISLVPVLMLTLVLEDLLESLLLVLVLTIELLLIMLVVVVAIVLFVVPVATELVVEMLDDCVQSIHAFGIDPEDAVWWPSPSPVGPRSQFAASKLGRASPANAIETNNGPRRNNVASMMRKLNPRCKLDISVNKRVWRIDK